MVYYGIITLSVVMFGVQFLISDRYEKAMGNSAASVFTLSLLSSLAGLACLFVINRFRLEFSRFTVLVAVLAAVNILLFSLCSLRALSRIDLSLYSLFSMLGGMMLPFLAGLVFYREPMTPGKAVCVVLVVSALLLTIDPRGKRGGTVYYCGVFVFNGMSGVLSKFFESAPFAKTSAAGYSMWISAITALFSMIGLILFRSKPKKLSLRALVLALCSGSMGQVANYLLLIALAVLPASVQYPFVTGGVMIVSTLLAAFTGQKPSKTEIFTVGLSFLGILALVLL